MALSGTMSNTYYNGIFSIITEWTATQNILDNTAVITAKVYIDTTLAYKTSSIPSYSGQSYVEIADTKYYFTTPAISGKGKYLVGTITSNPIVCNDETETATRIYATVYVGTLQVYITANGYYSRVVRPSVSEVVTLDAIIRSSSINVYGHSILGVENEIEVTRVSNNFTHTISYKCGTVTELICSKSSSENIKFTLPVSLALQEKTSTVLSVDFILTTYYNNTETKTKTVTRKYTIPSEVVPSCTITVTDNENLLAKYGGYVQSQSRLKIVVTPTLAYESPIATYSVTANGKTYNTAESVTEVLHTSGTNTIEATVTDERGRSCTVSVTVDVLPWSKPKITKIRVHRTDADGVEKSGGEYITVHFDAEVSPLNNVNTASYMLRYQKSSGLDQNDVNLDKYDNMLSVTNGFYTFEADTKSPYEVIIFVTDDFDTVDRSIGGSNAVTLLNFGADGESIGVGTIARIAKALEVAFKLYPSGGFIYPELIAGDSLYACTTPNVYYCEDGQDIYGSPTEDAFTLEVLPVGNSGQILQRVTTCPSDLTATPVIYIRHLRQSSWDEWRTIALQEI